MTRLTVYQMYENIDKQKTKKDKIDNLRKYDNVHFRQLLDYTFNPNIKWLLPEGEPPYKPCKDEPAVLILGLQQEIRRINVFVDVGKYPNLRQSKREEIFISILENIHPDDAKVLIAAKDRKTPFNSVNKKLVEEAFPEFKEQWKQPEKK